MLRTFLESNCKKVRTFSLSPKLRRSYIKKSIPLSTLYNSCECSLYLDVDPYSVNRFIRLTGELQLLFVTSPLSVVIVLTRLNAAAFI